MIHAYLFLYDNERDRNGHGPQFQKWMQTINEQGIFRDAVDFQVSHCTVCHVGSFFASWRTYHHLSFFP